MNRIDPEEFVSLMRPELERVAEFAACEQAGATPVTKDTSYEDPADRELGWRSRVGVISKTDLEIQERLLKFAYNEWPFISVLAEEKTATTRKFEADSEYCLLVDPIDGTKNYLAGGSEFCHTASLMRGDRMLVSMIYSHAKKKLYMAIAERGARASSAESLSKQIVIGPPAGAIVLCHVARIRSELMDELRMLGYDVRPSAQNATDILSMLDGDIVGFISFSPVVYDAWSPAMIIQEAGGWLSDWAGAPLRFAKEMRVPHLLVSTSPEELARMLPILERHLHEG